MDAHVLRTKDTESLLRERQERQTRLKELRFKVSTNQLKDVREIRELKRQIARINTILAGTSSKTE